MLEGAGVPVTVLAPAIDDGPLRPGRVTPEDWVTALAYLKARCGADAIGRRQDGSVLGADTVCVSDGDILGQPGSAADALAMIHRMRDAEHAVLTGACVISLADSRRWLLVDRADVRIGHVSDDEIERYVASGEWRGKAGAYNLEDRIGAGWPIDCRGDPSTVMGLPMRRLEPWFERLRAPSRDEARLDDRARIAQVEAEGLRA
jgi:septum formation protein